MKNLNARLAPENIFPLERSNVSLEENFQTAQLLPFSSPLQNKSNLFIKRLLDIIFSSCAIVFLLSWIVPIIGLLIVLDSKGPVFFLQKKNKKNGYIFSCVKFRSMVEFNAALLPENGVNKSTCAYLPIRSG